MDDFTPYGNEFEESLNILENAIKQCIQTNLLLNNEKCRLMMDEGVVLGHCVFDKGIMLDPTKIQVIINLPPPQK